MRQYNNLNSKKINLNKKSFFKLETKLKFYEISKKLEKGSEFTNSFLFLGFKHSFFAYIGLVSNILKTVLKFNTINPIELSNGWIYIENSEKIFNFLVKKLKKFSVYKNENYDVEIFKIDNHYAMKFEGTLWYENIDAQKSIFKKLSYNKDIKNYKVIPTATELEIIPFTNIEIYKSSKAEELYNRIDCFIQNNISRSVLINGPAGMGKSCIATYIADKYIKEHGGNIIHIDLKDYERIRPGDLQLFLEFFHSEVLIMDDIDKSSDPEALLQLLETNKSRHKIILATSNNLEILTESVIRPKRFDDIIYITELPREMLNIYKDLNCLLSEDQRLEILTWPIAYVDDLDIRRKNLKNFNLEDEMEELRSRLSIKSTYKPKRKKMSNDILENIFK